MLTFKDYIKELFDKSYPFTSTTNKELKSTQYHFTTKDELKGIVTLNYVYDYDYYNLDFSVGSKYDISGKGDQFTIFATVLDCIKDFINKQNPREIRFSAFKDDNKNKDIDSDSRVRLYSTMIRKFANTNGYEFKEKDTALSRKYVLVKN